MRLDGGADVVGGPTYLGGCAGMLPQELYLLFVCSKINSGAY